MSKLIKYIVSAAAALALSACSDEMPRGTEVNEEGHYVYKLDMDASLNDGTEGSRSSYAWTSSDYVYIAFETGESTIWGYANYSSYSKEWILRLMNNLPDNVGSGTCTCWYLKDKSYGSLGSGTTNIPLDATHAPYNCTTTFTRIGDKVAISAMMEPMMGRVRLRSTNSQNYIYQIAGPSMPQRLSLTDNTIYLDEIKASVYINNYEDGYYYSPYISGYYFANDTEHTFKIKDNNGNVFVRSYANKPNVLAPGKSGYIDLPSADSHDGWTRTAYANSSISYTYYGYANNTTEDDSYYFNTMSTLSSEIGVSASVNYQISQVYDGSEASKKTALLYIEAFDGSPDDSEPLTQTNVIMYQPDAGYQLNSTSYLVNVSLTLPEGITTTNTPQYRVSVITDGVRVYVTSATISNF